MARHFLVYIFCIFFFANMSYASDRDVAEQDLKGIPKSRKYFWSVLGGTAVGAGIGIVAPGGTKSAFKGALIGGSAASAFYLARRPRAEGRSDFAHIITNAALGTGIGWTVCDCDDGAWAGFLLGGGATTVYRTLIKPRRSRVASSTGGTAPIQADAQTFPGTDARTVASYQTQNATIANSGMQTSEKDKQGQHSQMKKPEQQPAVAPDLFTWNVDLIGFAK